MKTIRYPFVPSFIGGGFFVTFAICTYIAFMEDAWQSVIGCGLFALAGLVMMLQANWKIEYDGCGFTYRDTLRIRHHFSYDDIDSVRSLGKDTVLLVRHHIIILDLGCEGDVVDFLRYIRR